MRLTVLDEVAWEGQVIPGDRTVALLRALVGAGPRGLSEDELVDEVWADDTPANPRKALQVVVSRARSATSAEAIERTQRGYRLRLAPDEVDAWALRPEGLRLAAEGRYAEALPLLERADQDEEVVSALLRALAAAKGVPAALACYEQYRSRVAEQLGVDPSPALRAQYAALLAADRPVRGGVRYDADRLIGREADVAALRVLVGNHRVVSIVGTGGLGKTRLAHVIARAAEQPVVHVVELAGVTAAPGVAIAVADALGVRETVSGRSMAPQAADLPSRIVEAFGAIPTLLVLDNCEHLVQAVAELVATLVTRTPRLTVLTTTRIPLGLPAERSYLLPELSSDDAAALFTERATAARPGVVLDEAEVTGLVARLDGLPLALELAAAKVRSMSVAEITRRLDNRFALLRGGSRTAPERHQTLLAVIDWSWNLLTQEQRVALRRLAVFRDGFSADGASAVLDHEAGEVIEALVEQSLIVVDESIGVRYRLLETVREFGRMQLVDAGDDTVAEARLRAWAVQLCTYAMARLHTRDQVATVRLVRSEEGNLVDVLRRGLADRDVGLVATVFAGLAAFWMIEGTHVKVINMQGSVTELLLAVSTPPPEAIEAVRASLALAASNEMIFRGKENPPLIDRLRQLGPGSTQVAATVRILLETHDHGHAALAELSTDPDLNVARLALLWISHDRENDGDLAGAREASERALALCDDNQGPWMRAILLAGIGGLAFHGGDLATAARYTRQAVPILTELGAAEDLAQNRASLAMIAMQRGELDEAEKILDDVSRQDSAQSLFGAALALLCGRAELLLARGQIDEGLAAYTEALAVIREHAMPLLGLPVQAQPWVTFPQAAVVAAHVRHGRRAQRERDDLLDKVHSIVAGDGGLIDVPIAGCALLALGMWELCFGNREAGATLLAFAERFAFSRQFPSFDWNWATSLAQPAGIPDGTPAQLRPAVLALLATLHG